MKNLKIKDSSLFTLSLEMYNCVQKKKKTINEIFQYFKNNKKEKEKKKGKKGKASSVGRHFISNLLIFNGPHTRPGTPNGTE